MPAAACLRILIEPSRLEKPGGEALAKIAKTANAYLEAHWSYPRRFATMSPLAYVLTDGRANSVDPQNLQALCADLQTQLFGAADSGEASLLLFEGGQNDIAHFALTPADVLRMAVNAPAGFMNGSNARVTRIAAREVSVLRKGPEKPALPQGGGVETLACFRGIFLAAKQEFIGSAAARWRSDDVRHTTVLDGPTHFPTANQQIFDEQTMRACLDCAADAGGLSGLLFLPLSYSQLAKRTTRDDYAGFLSALEALPKGQLTAALYDVPRDPSLSALRESLSFLQERFGGIDLTITDPGFRFDSLAPGAVRSVSFCLPHAEDGVRLLAMKRFAENRDAFRQKNILPMVSNLRSAAELAASQSLKIPLVSGKAVTDILSKPLGMLPYMMEGLPFKALDAN